MKMLVNILVLSLAVTLTHAIACTPGVCSLVRCAAVTEDNCDGRVARNGGFCGCCDLCVRQLNKGESCIEAFLLGLSMPASSECGAGLTCNSQTHICEELLLSKRADPQTCQERLQQLQSGVHLLGQFLPTCAQDGTYAARQCHGSVCYCVDPSGVKIADYSASIGQSADMNCQCARDQYAYLQTGLIGKMFSCEDNGNYRKYGCTGSVCYCTDSLGQQLADSPTVNIGDLATLNC
ncbi:saxiphilin-like [Pomacea canaliculata]|uniref:saxiphilin-like n=1 Tax=Pomacea canaliculata TaxID=400727 RepID=UPI000D732EE3|nr:saxiphilin-like [Pomacea canaliculata]